MTQKGDPRDEMIAAVVRGKTFVDVGGLWGVHGEKCSVAHNAGAVSELMADPRPSTDPAWGQFVERLAGMGILRHVEFNTKTLDMLVGRQWDVVHCSGVLYHLPDPLAGIRQLHAITREWCILASMVAPSDMPGAFVPTLTTRDRARYADWFRPIVGDKAMGITTSAQWIVGNYDPWWWIPTDSGIEGMAHDVGFRVADRATMLDGRVAVFLLGRTS